MSQISVSVLVGGVPFPCQSFKVHNGGHGSTGSFEAMTSITALEREGFNLAAAAIESPALLEVDAFITVDGEQFQLFGGEYLSGDWEYKRDSVSIHARDWSGVLVDQKRVLVTLLKGVVTPLAPGQSATDSSGVSTVNQKLSQLVTAIANQFSLTPVLRLSSDSGSDPNLGTIFGNSTDTILTTHPQSLWAILNRFARATGNIVYTTPQKELVFGQPGAGLETLTFSWMQNPIPLGQRGLIDLSIRHNPRRNLTFRVVVNSYDPSAGQATTGQAYVIGSNFSTSEASTVKAGSWSGANASAISAALGQQKQGSKNAIPLYTFHVDGLTSAMCQQRATAIAADIAKRELVVTLEADLVPDVLPSQPCLITGNIDPEFAAHQYYATGYTHTYHLPHGDSTAGELATHLTLLDRQPEGQGNATQPG